MVERWRKLAEQGIAVWPPKEENDMTFRHEEWD